MRLSGIAISVLLLSPVAYAEDRTSPVEEIIIARSLRASRVPPTEYCSHAGAAFNALYEDVHTFHRVAVNSTTGRITDGNVAPFGELHSCYGKTAESGVSGFYAEGSLDGVPFTGLGDCRLLATDMPEPGMSSFRCFLKLTNLPSSYVGGVLTTNTLNSKKLVGEESDPPGYIQPSIATIRLWKKKGG